MSDNDEDSLQGVEESAEVDEEREGEETLKIVRGRLDRKQQPRRIIQDRKSLPAKGRGQKACLHPVMVVFV